MKTHTNEVLVYYNKEQRTAKQVLALAHTVSSNVKEVEYHKTRMSSTMWHRLLNRLDLRPKDLLNRADPYYQSNIRGRDFDREGWLNILIRNPDLIKAPIAVKGQRAVLCSNPTDIYQL